MTPWPADELARVLGEMGADLTPAEWAARSGHPEVVVRIAIGVVMREHRERLGWTVGMAAVRAGVARRTVQFIESGVWCPRAAADLLSEYRAEIGCRGGPRCYS